MRGPHAGRRKWSEYSEDSPSVDSTRGRNVTLGNVPWLRALAMYPGCVSRSVSRMRVTHPVTYPFYVPLLRAFATCPCYVPLLRALATYPTT